MSKQDTNYDTLIQAAVKVVDAAMFDGAKFGSWPITSKEWREVENMVKGAALVYSAVLLTSEGHRPEHIDRVMGKVSAGLAQAGFAMREVTRLIDEEEARKVS